MDEEQARPAAGFACATRNKRGALRWHEAPAPLAPIADTHAHLTCFWGKRPPEVLARAALAGVRSLTTLYDPVGDGRDVATYRAQLDAWIAEARDLLAGDGAAWEDDASVRTGAPAALPPDAPTDPASLLDYVQVLVGVHPYGAPDYDDAVHAQVIAMLEDRRCAGIGEIGLDYHLDHADHIEPAPHDVQLSCMARQLEIARARDLPVELHLRNDADDAARSAHADAYRLLDERGVPAAGCVLHCFGEDRATMERFVELGCYVAFGGAATFGRNEHVREAFAACPLDRILFETDCPYMAPVPVRGLECEPAMIAWTVDALARDRAERTGEDPRRIARAAWENARRLFGSIRGRA